MRIAYRRLSGSIGLTDSEKGTRGLWWEKRRALIMELNMRRHEVLICSKLTTPTASTIRKASNEEALECDIMLVEFGGLNMQFYGAEIHETIKLCRNFKGPKVYICDDPDLPMPWHLLGPLRHEQWSTWNNAVYKKPIKGTPLEVRVMDFPFASLQEIREPRMDVKQDKFVYIGRPNGRLFAVRALVAGGAPWKVYGRQKEWEEHGIMVNEPPQQPQRADFYAEQIGSLVLSDSKHKELGWRTGRAYHAAMAGCPAVVEADHEALKYFARYKNCSDLIALRDRWRDPDLRSGEVRRQVQNIWSEKVIAEKTLSEAGL